MIQQSHRWSGMLFLTGAAACWGIATVLSKALLSSVPPLSLLTIQLTASTLLLWLLVVGMGQPLPAYSALLRTGLLGLLNPGISYALSLWGLSMTTASMSTLLWASEPVLILGLAWLLFRETLMPKLALFALIALGGVLCITIPDIADFSSSRAVGNMLILAGVCCCALYTVLAQRTAALAPPLVAVTVQQTLALLLALLLLPIEFYNRQQLPAFHLIGNLGAAVIVTGVIYYALAFWLYLQGLARIRATLAAIFINLIPLFGISAAYFFLGERLTAWQWIGAGIIVVAVFLLLWQQAREP